MKTVYVLGAGVDRALGLPLADGLLRELDAFVKGDGAAISRALKQKLGGGRRVRFSFEKYISNQGENFAERILTDSSLAATVEGALEQVHEDGSEGVTAMRDMIDRLREIRRQNELDEQTAIAVATLAGESEDMADHTILRMRGITLNPAPRNAMLKIFRQAQANEGLTDEEQQVLGNIVAVMTNFEDLLTELFAGFYTGRATDIRNYLYVSWVLWSYMRSESYSARDKLADTESFYDHLMNLSVDDSIITFNYTSICDLPPERTVRFHGDCLSYIRHDRGELIANDEAVTAAQSLDALEAFIRNMEMNVDEGRIFLPAIVPPSAMKPVIHRDFIARWSRAETAMDGAELIVAVGYAFNRIDSHFNDLFRAAGAGKRIAVINPDIDGIRGDVCRLLGIDSTTLSNVTMAGIRVHRSSQLLLVPQRGEEVTDDMLSAIRAGWQ